MSKRVLIGSFVGALVIGGAAAGFAMASGPTKPSLENNSARYTAPSGDGAGSFSFTTDVSDDSGVKSLHVLPWPTEWKLDPTERETRDTEEAATCRKTSDETSRCTYTLKVSEAEAAALETGTWKVTALATAEDGDTLFVPSAATFELEH
ncbi:MULTISPECIES: DUF5707 domain-containing protein [unclassified Streptomyces]|uniref:DUF5707 domain-containing protein n=1 Tax=unclassified Streptomyces TaxID=2593676 RepID=UPI0007EDCC0E|nr:MULTISPECIES: DUF5707 domain-containing protein [unclassified Streptomyces]MCP3770831.1 DUF5707 domain-containing protein [Streptomyces sp. MAR25Y5]OBQ49163.1 hypothetical protein A4U61_29825 [Streptomyces sp. H-KF8]